MDWGSFYLYLIRTQLICLSHKAQHFGDLTWCSLNSWFLQHYFLIGSRDLILLLGNYSQVYCGQSSL